MLDWQKTTKGEKAVWLSAVENEEYLVYMRVAFPSDEDLLLTDSDVLSGDQDMRYWEVYHLKLVYTIRMVKRVFVQVRKKKKLKNKLQLGFAGLSKVSCNGVLPYWFILFVFV